jgi:AcrR family transcriptional regulator
MKSASKPAPRAVARVRLNAVRTKPAAPKTKRGRETRERLKTALIELLQERAYQEIRLEDITDRAGSRVSLFYHYFQSKADIAQEVLTDMLEAFKLEVGRRQKDADPLATIHYANQRTVALYANNPGAMRCLVDSKDDSAPFAQTWRSITLDWNRRIAASIARQFPGALPRNDAYLALAFALSGMVDDFLFEYFVNEQAALRQAYPTHDAVAAFLTTLWCRALYLRNPGDITSPGFTEISGDPGL